MAKDFSGWLTKAQVADRLQVSTKTVEALAAGGKLHQEIVPREGRPPIALYHPADVEKERERRNPEGKAFLVPQERPQGADAGLAVVKALAAITERLEMPVAPAAAEPGPMYITIEEAVQILGLSERHLRRRIADGTVRAARLKVDGRIVTKVARADLEKV